MMTKELTRWCTVLLFGLMAQAQAQAASNVPASGSQCAAPGALPVCILPKPVSDELALRALRLQEAVNNGDLSPQEAQKIMQGKHVPFKTMHGLASSAPLSHASAAPQHDHFWREERRRISPNDPN